MVRGRVSTLSPPLVIIVRFDTGSTIKRDGEKSPSGKQWAAGSKR
jgi:hypothetical protein